jgi:hypothetical protein
VKVFLSHASESKPRVRRLTQGLPRHVEVWLDADELEAGQKFPQHIERGIREECDFVLVFVDGHALDSPWVRRETAQALQRQADLQRSFVLPVLLDDVCERMAELGLDAEQLIYIDARDASDDGVARGGQLIAAELFKLASRLVESLRSADRRALIDGFASELAEYEQVAFRWLAAMGNRLPVLAEAGPANDHLRECLAAYNAVGDRFIPRLAQHRDRLAAAWRGSPALRNHIRALIDFVEDGVYRGAMFALNEVLQMLHALGAGPRPAAAALDAQEARKGELIAAAQRALDKMTSDASELVNDLTSELGP